jgi:hypothetical protein
VPYGDAAFEDYELLTRLAPRYRLTNIPAVLHRYRAHVGQSHTLEAKAFALDMARCRFGHFFSVYPDATLPDYVAIARVSDRVPLTSLDELGRAGRWMVRLAQPPDPWLRSKMALRWREACERTEASGLAVGGTGEPYQVELDALARLVEPTAI